MLEIRRMPETRLRPTHRAYALKRDGTNSRWLEIGVASAHDDGKGFDVCLDRLPIGGFNGYILVRKDSESPQVPEVPARPAAEGS